MKVVHLHQAVLGAEQQDAALYLRAKKDVDRLFPPEVDSFPQTAFRVNLLTLGKLTRVKLTHFTTGRCRANIVHLDIFLSCVPPPSLSLSKLSSCPLFARQRFRGWMRSGAEMCSASEAGSYLGARSSRTCWSDATCAWSGSGQRRILMKQNNRWFKVTLLVLKNRYLCG